MRYPIIPLRIAEIKNSSFYRGNREEKTPSFIVTKLGEKIVRVGIVGTLVDRFINQEATYSRLTVCDETGDIIVKCFGNVVNESLKVDIGSSVFLFGKIGEITYRFIRAEFLKKIDFKFESFFKLKVIERIKRNSLIVEEVLKLSEILSYNELVSETKRRFELEEFQIMEILKIKTNKNLNDKILEIIEKFSDDGVSLSDIISLLRIDKEKVIDIIESLMESGKIYEVLPGKYKIIK